MFCEEKYNVFPKWLSFITKLNSNQLNIYKKIDEDNFGKKILQKKKLEKKPCEEKLYQSIVFCEEKLIFTCNCNF